LGNFGGLLTPFSPGIHLHNAHLRSELTADDVTNIHCLLRIFDTHALPIANPLFCQGINPTQRWVARDNHGLELPPEVAYVNGEWILGEKLHALWWKDASNPVRNVVAYRHQEDANDGLYAIKHYGWEGAIIQEMKLLGDDIPEAVASVVGFFLRKGKGARYTRLAKNFLKEVVTLDFNAGEVLILAGYSLGGGLAQLVGLDETLHPAADYVVSFAGNGPITKKDRQRDIPIVNFASYTDITQRIGCHSNSAKVCLYFQDVPHESWVYGNGPRFLHEQMAMASALPHNIDWDIISADRIWCVDGHDYNNLCGACRNDKTHPNVHALGAEKQEAGTNLIRREANHHRICQWDDARLAANNL